MNKNFQVDLTYVKGEEGSADQKQVTEKYIFKAINYTDAETKLHKFAEENSIRDFTYKITNVKISEFINENAGADNWLSKTSYITTTPAGKEKTIKETQLVNARNISEAMQLVTEYFRNITGAVHTRLIGLQETEILEVVE